ncbi:MAG TPA: M20 peptidase aminoacylase family protein [Bacillales bacterium]|nr:M20 peptidase aminoacylase family protein [Bacillales bacterium]
MNLANIFEHLHAHPEISWEEHETTEYVRKMLAEHGYRVRTFDECTGVIGEIGSGRPVVALRADIDALWQQVGGHFRANHSCGHDAHMTMVLGVAETAKELVREYEGTVRLIFQPAEEKGAGALKMVELGVADDIDYLYGVHLRPIEEARFGKAAPAILHGASRLVEGKIIGKDTHGARPHLGINAIDVGSSLNAMINRVRLDPMIPHSIKMTKFRAGGKNANIIPGSAVFSVDMRAQSNQLMEALDDRFKRIIEPMKDQFGVDIRLATQAVIPASEVSEDAQHIMADAICDVLGHRNMLPAIETPGGDDFHFYTLKRPHLKATMLGLGCDLQPGLHHPDMTFNREAIGSGVEILTRAIKLTLEHGKEA